MTRFPLRYAHQNILVGQGDARAALFRVDTVSYPFLAVADKREWLRRPARFAFAVEADFSLWRVCRAYPAAGYADQAMALLDERGQSAAAWRAYLNGHEAHLRELRSFTPEVYLAVSLPSQRSAGVDRMRRRIEGLFGVEHPVPIPASDIDALVAAEERAFRRAEAALPVRRATTRELQWLLRRAASRGVAEPALDDHWEPSALIVETAYGQPAYEPLGTDIVRHCNAPVFEQDRALVVDAEAGRTHQAMLGMGALPEESEFPGGAELLFSPLEALPFPVDVVLHARWLGNREAISRVRRRIVDADVAFSEQLQSTHGPLSYVAEENRALARELDAYLQSHERPPLLNVAISLAVGAPSEGELEQRVEALVHRYGTVALHRPLGLQPALFLDHLPRADGGTVRDYADVLTIEQFGALMPIGTHQAGSERGVLIGRTLAGGARPVRFDVTEASRAGRPPSILLAGTLGSGKTIAAELLAFQAERRGSLVVDVDPKPDHNLEGLPELDGRVHVIELSGDDRYRGLLDPLSVAPESLREDLASSYLVDLLPQSPPAWETQVRKAVRQAIESPAPSCLRVLELLLASSDSDARAAGEALSVWADSGVARLGFGDGDRARVAAQRPVTTIKARGLSLPAPGIARGDYDQAERLGVATLKLIAAYAMRLVAGDRSVHKVVLFDEAWFLLASRDGRRLIDRLNRLGRAENATLILATQQLTDVGEIENLIGTRFIFGQETAAEARRALELLGLDPEDRALVERVRSYRRGRCLMRDIDDRVAELQIETVHEHLLRILDTSPGARPVLEAAA
ncbi:ATP-binding protein [Solirubrobacter sp. CPCC 204708]|uniref:ATP-binding protein n=1 Tax=Solirubrobacter deserti TaxID=2282478 RepID=A0ABT4RD10_9ACTN|nr:ATP-binding protein [Solirubrobacter deserti]MBE2317823.1 ATP-binding protein [Solirubrobacter deserti]MDA0136400.1 ATP-binding protein [Solirubrobacter deserti]